MSRRLVRGMEFVKLNYGEGETTVLVLASGKWPLCPAHSQRKRTAHVVVQTDELW